MTGASSRAARGLADAVATRRSAELLAEEGVTAVHVGIWDTSDTLRTKRYRPDAAAELLECGGSFINSIQGWDHGDAVVTAAVPVHEPIALDPGSARPLPFEPASILVLADFAGPSAALSPRALLTGALARVEALGLTATMGWELETILLAADTASLQAAGWEGAALDPIAPANRCWSGLTPMTHADLLGTWTGALAAGGVELDHVCSELGPGCWELATRAGPALRAADDAAFLKVVTRAMAHRLGMTASFMAQLDDTSPGLGGHPSLSLRDRASGSPVFPGERAGVPSPLARHAVGGVLRAVGDLFVLLAPTVNSYRRFAPRNWAPRTATWGVGNYTCGVRLVLDRADTARLELRLPGADVPPHLCAALLVAAVAWGIEHEAEPPPPTDGMARDVVHAELGPLPRTLLEATERFERSPLARSWFGDRFVDHWAATRRAEDDVFRGHVSALERARYLDHV